MFCLFFWCVKTRAAKQAYERVLGNTVTVEGRYLILAQVNSEAPVDFKNSVLLLLYQDDSSFNGNVMSEGEQPEFQQLLQLTRLRTLRCT